MVGPAIASEDTGVASDWLNELDTIGVSQYYSDYGYNPAELVGGSVTPTSSAEEIGSSYSTQEVSFFDDPTTALESGLLIPEAAMIPPTKVGGTTIPPELELEFGNGGFDEPTNPFGDDPNRESLPEDVAGDLPSDQNTNPLGDDSPFENGSALPASSPNSGFGQFANSPSVPANIVPKTLSSDSIQLADGTTLDGTKRYVLSRTDCDGANTSDIATRSWTEDGVTYTETITT